MTDNEYIPGFEKVKTNIGNYNKIKKYLNSQNSLSLKRSWEDLALYLDKENKGFGVVLNKINFISNPFCMVHIKKNSPLTEEIKKGIEDLLK